MKLLKFALEQQNYDLAARVLVYGLLKAMVKQIEEEKNRRPKRQPERTEARILQPGT
jgi:hypothetical protein